MLDFNLEELKVTGPCQGTVCVCVCDPSNKRKARFSLSSGVKHKTQYRQTATIKIKHTHNTVGVKNFLCER